MIFIVFITNIPLQSLRNHAAQRLCQVQNDKVTFHYKARFDDPTGQSIYKQKMSANSLRDLKKRKVIVSNLSCSTSDYNLCRGNPTIRRNQKLLSTLYCRSLRFKFEKESTNLILIEETYLKDGISNIVGTGVFLWQVHFSQTYLTSYYNRWQSPYYIIKSKCR